MESARSSPELSSQLTTLYTLGSAGSLTDGQLVEQFLARLDPAASEAAFTALVDRHGAMVLSVCRQLLNDPHDAEDAFQATFLILVSKAGSIRRREAVGGWLFGIARGSRRAQIEAARRRRQLRALTENPPGSRTDAELAPGPSAETGYGPLVPGVQYNVSAIKKNEPNFSFRGEGYLHKNRWSVKPGETVDWGDVQVQIYRR